MHPYILALTVEHWLYLALGVVAAVLSLWALVDCAPRPAAAFERAGQRTKTFWLVLTAIAFAVSALGLWSALTSLGGGFGLLNIIALCVAAVYLAGPRSELKLYGGGGRPYGY